MTPPRATYTLPSPPATARRARGFSDDTDASHHAIPSPDVNPARLHAEQRTYWDSLADAMGHGATPPNEQEGMEESFDRPESTSSQVTPAGSILQRLSPRREAGAIVIKAAAGPVVSGI